MHFATRFRPHVSPTRFEHQPCRETAPISLSALGRGTKGEVERLQEMGAWLKRYGESIYGTRGGPFKPGAWGASTCRSKYLYLHVFTWPAEGLRLPLTGKTVRSAKVLTGGKAVITRTAEEITVDVEEKARQAIDTVIRLKLDRSAEDIPPLDIEDGARDRT